MIDNKINDELLLLFDILVDHIKTNRLDEAVKTSIVGLSLDPIGIPFLVLRGIIYCKKENLEEALYYFKKSLKIQNIIKDNIPVTYWYIGLIYYRKNDYRNALKYSKLLLNAFQEKKAVSSLDTTEIDMLNNLKKTVGSKTYMSSLRKNNRKQHRFLKKLFDHEIPI